MALALVSMPVVGLKVGMAIWDLLASGLTVTVKGEVLPEVRPKGDTSAYAVVRPKE